MWVILIALPGCEFVVEQVYIRFEFVMNYFLVFFSVVMTVVLIDYVPGNIINLMWPPPLCAAGPTNQALS